MKLIKRIEHHHNSVRFNCQCGEKHHEWPHSDEVGQTTLESVIKCPCGRIHWKKRLNWRGEGKLQNFS